MTNDLVKIGCYTTNGERTAPHFDLYLTKSMLEKLNAGGPCNIEYHRIHPDAYLRFTYTPKGRVKKFVSHTQRYASKFRVGGKEFAADLKQHPDSEYNNPCYSTTELPITWWGGGFDIKLPGFAAGMHPDRQRLNKETELPLEEAPAEAKNYSVTNRSAIVTRRMTLDEAKEYAQQASRGSPGQTFVAIKLEAAYISSLAVTEVEQP